MAVVAVGFPNTLIRFIIFYYGKCAPSNRTYQRHSLRSRCSFISYEITLSKVTKGSLTKTQQWEKEQLRR